MKYSSARQCQAPHLPRATGCNPLFAPRPHRRHRPQHLRFDEATSNKPSRAVARTRRHLQRPEIQLRKFQHDFSCAPDCS